MTLYIFDFKPVEVSLMFVKVVDVVKTVCFSLFASQCREHQSLIIIYFTYKGTNSFSSKNIIPCSCQQNNLHKFVIENSKCF